MANPIETWKAEKPPLDVWPDMLKYAEARTPMKEIPTPDLERMKWHGFYYRKRDGSGSYMTRIRLSGCELTSEQAKEIAYIAYEHGYGIVDITTRGNLQIQGLSIEKIPKIADRFQAVGLTAKQTGHDNIRNVFGHPFSGLMPEELIDTRELCREITALFIDSPVYTDLPRKMNICLNGTEHHGSYFWSQDISFLACRGADDEVLFQMLIGGTQGQQPRLGQHLPVLVRPDQVVDVTRALLDLFREQGTREKRNRARFRFLLERIGINGILEYLEEHLDFPLQPCVNEPAPPTGYDDLIGWFRQTDPKLWTMGLCVPVGRLSWRQLEALAIASKKWGDGTLRTTHEQGIAIANIPTGFKGAAATDAAACGLSLHADSLARSTMACTGAQFCNIAVTETKGQMFQLIEKLRQRALALHGIRIHMSGCPSSCAQHFTADIGLKGVRVKRLLGTREGFDVYLGGGISGQVHLGIPYRLGVDADQLPQLIEEVTAEYYLKHRSGQTFSAYWREKLREAEAAKVGDAEYLPPTWVCESCEYRHLGEDPPVFCPKCAGLRRHFARLEDGTETETTNQEVAPTRSDGYSFAAKVDSLNDGEGLNVTVAGQDLALFRVKGKVQAIDNACPHEGGPLAEGEVDAKGVVTCPWHGWTFDACNGCSLDPADNNVSQYKTKIEEGQIFVKVETGAATSPPVVSKLAKAASATLTVTEIIQETPDTKTFRLDNSGNEISLDLPGRFLRVCVPIDGKDVWRSFTFSSSPIGSKQIDLTIKRNPAGDVSNYLHDKIATGDTVTCKGPQGGFYFDPESHTEPLVLLSAGSGITPMMSILRFLTAANSDLPCTFLHGARTAADIIFHEECTRLADAFSQVKYTVSLSQPTAEWTGATGRLDYSHVRKHVADIPGCRYFLCGPNDFMNSVRESLIAAGVPRERVHTEAFHASPKLAEA